MRERRGSKEIEQGKERVKVLSGSGLTETAEEGTLLALEQDSTQHGIQVR